MTCAVDSDSCESGDVWIPARTVQDEFSLECALCDNTPSPPPTMVPTPAPTRTSELLVVPEILELAATKPEHTSGHVTIMNPNEEDMQVSITTDATTLPAGVSWWFAPSDFVLPHAGIIDVSLHVDSTRGLQTMPETYTVVSGCCSPKLLRVEPILSLSNMAGLESFGNLEQLSPGGSEHHFPAWC